jgi:hypothetical protein
MSIIWMDLINGDDSTGDGSYANPYQNGPKCATEAYTDDEIRVKATGSYTNVVDDITFTYNSTTVNTTGDLSGSISVGDWIGKGGVAKENGVKEHFYRVTAVGTSTLTLESHYFGDTETVSSIDILTYGTSTEYQNAIFSAQTTRTRYYVRISGGWDSETTQNGVTWVRPATPRNNSYYLFGAYSNYHLYYSMISNINFVDFGRQAKTSSMLLEFNNVTLLSYGGRNTQSNGKTITYTNCCDYSYDAQGYGYYNATYSWNNCYFFGRRSSTNYFYGMRNNQVYEINNCEFYGMYGLVKNLVDRTNPSQLSMSNSKFYNCTRIIECTAIGVNLDFNDTEVYDSGYSIYVKGDGCFFNNLKTYRATSSVVYSSQGCNNTIENFYCEDCTGSNFYTDEYVSNFVVQYCEFVNPGTRCVYMHPYNIGNRIIGCTVEEGVELFYQPSGIEHYLVPRVTVTGCTHSNGRYSGRFSLTEESPVHSTTNVLKIQNMSTYNSYKFPIILSSFYVKASTTKRIKFYYKMDNGWTTTGGLIFEFLLNKNIIQTETAITTISEDWIELDITIDSSLIYADGVIDLVVYPNGNTKSVYVDNIRVVQ